MLSTMIPDKYTGRKWKCNLQQPQEDIFTELDLQDTDIIKLFITETCGPLD